MNNRDHILVFALCAALFLAAGVFRPVLPIDETRYLTVAWEMFLNKTYFLPTLNFAPYHHKPPMMFWLINASWNVFGVSRWAAFVPFFAAALALVYLTRALTVRLFPDHIKAHRILPFLVIGSFPFLIYSTLIMFDVLLTIFVLSTLLLFLSFAEKPHLWKVLLAGAFLGLAGLTKGPVAALHTLLPLALYALWRGKKQQVSGRLWAGALIMATIIGLGIVSIWLINMLPKTDSAFAYTLLWKQTAGRVTGNMESAHARPLYFYLPLLPVLFLPWILFPEFWRRAKSVLTTIRSERAGLRLLALWVVPAFVIFSAIAGKQPHYIVPLFPPILIFISLCLENISTKTILQTTLCLVLLVCGGQAIASVSVFKNYDLEPLAKHVAENHDRDWAFIRKYQGELGFLGRLTKPVFSMNLNELHAWFLAHPQGMAVIRHNPKPDPQHPLEGAFKELYTWDYRGKAIGIYSFDPKPKEKEPAP